MYLSIGLIQESLSHYTIKPYIVNNEMCIRNVSLLSQGKRPDGRHTLYVCPSESVIPTLQGKTICVNKNNYIIVYTEKWDEVFCEIVDAVDMYFGWDQQIREDIAAGCSLQHVLDCAAPILKEMICVGNMGFFVQAVAGIEYVPSDFEAPDYFKVGNPIPNFIVTDILEQISTFLRSDEIHYVGASIVNLEGYSRNHFQHGMLCGASGIYTSKERFTETTRQLFSVFTSHVDKWMEANPEFAADFPSHQQYLLQILNGEDVEDRSKMNDFFTRIGWAEYAEKQLFLIENIHKESYVYYRLNLFFSNRYPYCLYEYEENELYIVVNTETLKLEELLKDLQREFENALPFIGISYPFTNMFRLRHYREQAALALTMGKKKGKLINYCDEYVLAYVKTILQNKMDQYYAHPSLLKIKKYDDENGTDYFGTLYAYLVYERRHEKTAKALNIHVNTLTYRLAKINDLVKLDLDNPEFRQRLLLSYMILK